MSIEESLKPFFQHLEERAAQIAEERIRAEFEKPEYLRYEPLWDAKKMGEVLSVKPKAVYAMVADGRIPRDCLFYISETHYRFIPDKVRALIEEGRLRKAKTLRKVA